jgi:hypothetical protein
MINALEIDFVANEEDLWALLAQIRAVHVG